jgi:hypothetical protein
MVPTCLMRYSRRRSDQFSNRLSLSKVYPPVEKRQLGELTRFGRTCSRCQYQFEEHPYYLRAAMTEYLHLVQTGVRMSDRHEHGQDLIQNIAFLGYYMSVPHKERGDPVSRSGAKDAFEYGAAVRPGQAHRGHAALAGRRDHGCNGVVNITL